MNYRRIERLLPGWLRRHALYLEAQIEDALKEFTGSIGAGGHGRHHRRQQLRSEPGQQHGDL